LLVFSFSSSNKISGKTFTVLSKKNRARAQLCSIVPSVFSIFEAFYFAVYHLYFSLGETSKKEPGQSQSMLGMNARRLKSHTIATLQLRPQFHTTGAVGSLLPRVGRPAGVSPPRAPLLLRFGLQFVTHAGPAVGSASVYPSVCPTSLL
jgi:hypothetical protein